MKVSLLLFIVFLIPRLGFSQIVINELDCDTPGIDDVEFVELLSETPNFSLDGFVLVFFNGSTNGQHTSYFALDLDGYETDVNGLLLIGSINLSPFPQYVIAPNSIQNGVDAVAIYKADDLDFEEPVKAYVDDTLIDVLIYRTTQSDGNEFVSIFSAFNPSIQIISEGATNNTNSIQRNNDGTYTVKSPTPRQLNDGSGVVLNGILMTIVQTSYNEGETLDIVLTSEQTLTSDISFTITLNNGTFNTSDFTGNTSITILNGTSTSSTSITLIDDDFDEGDEEMLIKLLGLVSPNYSLNNNLRIRVVDNDFQVAPFGTPINPTYGMVTSTQPAGYYNSLDGQFGSALHQALQDIIAEEGVVKAQTYADIIDILKEADQNPSHSNQVWLVYKEMGRAKLDYQTTSNSIGKWNKEHIFPRSRGGFNSIDLDEIADGKSVFWNTTADSLRHGNSDAHALRAADGPENSSRGNQFYGEYNGPSGTLGKFKGDVARSVFYMAVRYNGLEIVNGYPEGIKGQFGDLTTLLDWHRNDPPDDFEMNRNNVVYTWQYNRNPFIDQPDLVEYLWGNRVGQVWSQSLATDAKGFSSIKIFPNPTMGTVFINGIKNDTVIDVFSLDGRKLKTHVINQNTSLELHVSRGIYLLKVSSNGKIHTQKVVVN
ncbi:Extracellular ribonuclease precursor [Mariniflexile rhizosphaerae]|uniref:endonuclease n=1 Tax=unclassified Mariniflexile TaxID=2643887 RepID=UPI000CBD925A|nr:endonuclease [Mariniflexile sp. TRM1-10]AXP81833.1 Extracellular ribonuclease precursor [Mariniflexile sp. TRM1-10]PLB20783.1 MAG: Endonuclease I family protein [Flavobacteriaceae bacterium FS1-H7996/R]